MTDARRSIRRHLWAATLTVALLAGGVGGWAASTDIAGAVIASGNLVVESNVKKVQHPTGGVVGEILARDGDRVRLGDVIVRLDETVTRANLAIVAKGLDELMARKARLAAERDGADEIEFPAEMLQRAGDPSLANTMAGERRLFELRRTARVGQEAQLRQRIAQLMEEISGITSQREAKLREITLVERELTGARDLWDRNLMPITKLTALEREATRLEGERGSLTASIAQSKGRISELELQIIQITRDMASEVGKDLRETEAKIGEFVERKATAEDQLKRIDIRAPQDGTIHQSTVHTVGGVVSAGDAIMLVVPDAESLMVEAKVQPQDIDQLQLGQRAVLRFSTFNQRTTPEINGTLARISADALQDQRTGVAAYLVRVALTPEEIGRLGDVKLVPGMPVEAFLQTGNRSVMSYLVKPLHDQITRAFRER
jgi:HlyD family secretion protein